MQTACRIAVEILNDLLCFDKLESGILELHKHEVPVKSFIADCVNMFGSQAREAGVDISNNSLIKGEQNSSQGTSSGWLDSDTVLMDKFKMDQVLRNLISNALKFTPRGGSVAVCASFVPNDSPQSNSFTNLRRSTECDVGQDPMMNTSAVHGWFSLDFWHSIFPRSEVALDKSCDIELGVYNGREMMKKKVEPSWLQSRLKWTQDVVVGDNDLGDVKNCNLNISALKDSEPSAMNIKVVSGRLRIVVTDTGAGISEENLARLFKEIVQFNPEVLQAGGGSGLGLYITSSIVQMHGGTIHAHSEGAGTGSTFTVEIDMQLRRSHSHSPLSLQSGTPFVTIVNPGLRSPGSKRHPPRSYREDKQYEEDICFTRDAVPRAQLPSPVPSSQQPATHQYPSGHRPPPRLIPQPVDPRNGQTWCDLRELHSSKPLSLLIDASSINGNTTSPSASVPTGTIRKTANTDDEGEVVYDILVVDDSSLNRKMLCRLLRTAGYTCDEANDGESAVEKVKARIESGIGGEMKGFYDAILMDFVMPVMDGPTATQAIRGLGYSDPIFGVTGNALDSDINYFMKCGATAVLIKPFDFDLFKRLMNENSQHASL